ncbi:MAG: hypothetical protein GX084_00585 [Acholeplasmataceae bacterium]|nr:hypothetical protein [Acholeplasmataceae bacterium]
MGKLYKNDRKGAVALAVLLAATVMLTAVSGLLLLIEAENEAQRADITKKQITALAEGLMQASIERAKQGLPVESYNVPNLKLFPGRVTVSTHHAILEYPAINARRLQVSITDKTEEWCLYQDLLNPPGGRGHEAYSNTLYARNGVLGDVPAGIVFADGSAGYTEPDFEVNDYRRCGCMVLPSQTELNDYGLQRRVYFNTLAGGAYTTSDNALIKGEGVLVDESGITLGRGCRATDSLWLISGSSIIIEDDVQLDKALILAKKNISIGNNVRINGIIICGGRITIGNDFFLNRLEEVLTPFTSVCYFI